MNAQRGFLLRGTDGFMLRHVIGMRFNMHFDLKHVGACGFHLKLPDGTLLIDYDVLVHFRRRRFATQAVGLLCRWGFEKLEAPRILAKVPKTNIASQKVLGHNGFGVYASSRVLYHYEKLQADHER